MQFPFVKGKNQPFPLVSKCEQSINFLVIVTSIVQVLQLV